MSKQWGHGFHSGMSEGIDIGEGQGKCLNGYFMANEMRVLLCALITSHKRRDEQAFFATVEIAKATVGKYANFSDEDWAVFRGDHPRKDVEA